MQATYEQSYRLIKLSKVKEYTSLSTSEIYRRLESGAFPKQVRLGTRSVAWVEAEIIAWCSEVIACREDS